MNISELYASYRIAASQKLHRGDPQRGEKLRAFYDAKSALFWELRAAHQTGLVQDPAADDIAQSLADESRDPIAFWGNERIAKKNHAVFVHDKESRLFDALLHSWLEQR